MSSLLTTLEADNAGLERPLRVCVITDCAHGIGGMQRHTHDLIQGLVRAGHEVEVICPADASLGPRAYGARWHLVETSPRTDKRWREKLRAAFIEVDRSKPFDVVHSESTAAHGLLYKPRVATPIVVKYHGCYLSLAKAQIRRAIQRPRASLREGKSFVHMTFAYLSGGYPWMFRSLVSMSPSHEQVKDTARSHLIPTNLMHPVPNGIDAEAFRPRDHLGLRRALDLPDGTLLVTAGRLNKEKGVELALEALSRIAGEHPCVRLLILGDGEQRDYLELLAATLGVRDRVLFLGAQSSDRVADYFAASDVFLFPTRRHEAGPIVLLEGMACGLPAIATDIGGNTEVVRPAGGPVAGLLTRMGSVDDLEAAIRRVLTDKELARTLGQRARQRILEEYTVETMIERTVGVYRIAIARSARLAANRR
jgi:glycosyltransferase involved in cell wall biosynthesis